MEFQRQFYFDSAEFRRVKSILFSFLISRQFKYLRLLLWWIWGINNALYTVFMRLIVQFANVSLLRSFWYNNIAIKIIIDASFFAGLRKCHDNHMMALNKLLCSVFFFFLFCSVHTLSWAELSVSYSCRFSIERKMSRFYIRIRWLFGEGATAFYLTVILKKNGEKNSMKYEMHDEHKKIWVHSHKQT